MASLTKSPGTAVDDDSIGTSAWTNPTNVLVEDGILATAGIYTSVITAVNCKLIKGGIKSGDTKTISWPVFPLGYETYGASNDLWGVAWMPSDINSSNFGVAYWGIGNAATSHYLNITNFNFNIPGSAQINGIVVEPKHTYGGGELRIDYMRVTVYYTDGGVHGHTGTVGVLIF